VDLRADPAAVRHWVINPGGNVEDELSTLFDDEDVGSQRMMAMLLDETITEITANGHRSIFYVGPRGKMMVRDQIFAGPAQYIRWLNQMLSLTDVGYTDIDAARTHVIEGSFREGVRGSLHICTREITRGEPFITVRKQPRMYISLDEMVSQKVMPYEIRHFFELAMRGRLNMLISGSSGAGKTTMARALSAFVDPAHRVISVEEIDELHLEERLPNVVNLTTYRLRDDDGRVIREVALGDLVKESLRMRADRIWVGEVRGAEAKALCSAANSGHDGSLSTIHADDAASALRQAVTYVMEGGVAEEVARDQVGRAFHLVVQVSKIRPTERRITEVIEVESVREGTEQRRNTLFRYDYFTDSWVREGHPSKRLLNVLAKYGVEYAVDDGPAPRL
jgi:pilus assembly protein CpaF